MGRKAHGGVGPFAILVAVMLTVIAVPANLAAKDGSVQALVKQLNTTLLDVMQSADALGYQGRYEKLDPPLRASFDFAFMTKIAVGHAWNDFDQAQREQLIERFSQMSIATFAARFDGYSGERFEIMGEKPGPRQTVIVDDQIVRPEDPPVGLNFVLREETGSSSAGTWLIIDVMLDGKFSELARQRAEFSSVLRNDGYDGLIAALDERIEALRIEG